MSIVENIPEKIDHDSNQENNQEDIGHTDVNVEQAQPLTGESNGTMKKSRFNKAYFQQRTKFVRDLLAERKFQMRTDQTQLFIILFMSIIAVLCSLIGISTSNWLCDLNTRQCYGLWNTCFTPSVSLTIDNNSTIIMDDDNQTSITPMSKDEIKCAIQRINTIEIIQGEQSRLDQLTASQGLITCGTIMYFLAIVGMSLAYKYMREQNLNFVRNCLVTSMIVQIVSFVIQLVGFYLYILNETFSTSVGLLFVYFGLAIFSTNIINFFTIEYKSFKIRQVASLI
ncbi:unnamed protein product [Brachionus calyciflorus]|uniref:Transmembrane protein n=1 Tax=Brachionus calyciflorus TaxID=104777 RepID=A0A813Y461_9BILA|nr:unnamed protein product [Brachionus calyciflorus]